MAEASIARLRRRIVAIEAASASASASFRPPARALAATEDHLRPESIAEDPTALPASLLPRGGGRDEKALPSPQKSTSLHPGLLPPAPSTLARRAPALLPFAIPRLDQMLGGGLRRAALHEFRSAESREAAAVTGLAAALLSRLTADDDRPVLWITETAATSEAGDLYGAGLGGFGLDPARLIIVAVRRTRDALWVFEEGLRCRGLAAVLAEMSGDPRLLDLTASRRLALRAAEHGVMGLLVRPSHHPEPGAATTRWLVAPQPASPPDNYPATIGLPAWRLTLERNRLGATGAFDVEWNHDRRCFASLAVTARITAHPRPVAALPGHRPPAPPEAGKVVALPVLSGREESPRDIRRRIARAR